MSNFQPSYKLNLLIQRAENLLPVTEGTKPNPYIVFQLEGSTQKIQTKALKDTNQPIYNCELSLDGFFVGSDLLHVWVYNQADKKDGETEAADEVIGYATVYVNQFPLGEVQNRTLPLFKFNKKKNTIDSKSTSGEAGKVFFQVHVSQLNDVPFTNKEWSYPLYNAWLEIIDAKNCPPVSDGSADPIVSISVSPAANTQSSKTKSVHSLTPVWNHRFKKILLDNYQKQTINISMASKNKKDLMPMGDYKLSLDKCNVGHIYENSVELSPVNNQPPAILHYRLQITAKDTEPFKFIRDKDKQTFEEEESVKSKQSVASAETREAAKSQSITGHESQQSATYAERSIDISQQAADEEIQKERKRVNLSGNPQRRLLKGNDLYLEGIKVPKGISDLPCTLHVNLIEANNLQKDCDPLVTFALRSQKKESSVKSTVIQNTKNPKWNENYDLNSQSSLTDILCIDMYNQSPLPDNRLMDTIQLPVRELPYKGSYVFNRDVQLNDQNTGHLNFTISTETPEDAHCHFQWGDFGSSYSSSFTGYSHKGHSISDHPSDEKNTYHVHAEVLKEVAKPKKIENVIVYITGFADVPFESKDVKTYLTVERRNKIKQKGSAKRYDDLLNLSQAIAFKFDNVKPGNIFEVKLYQILEGETKPVLVCGKQFKVKELDFDSKPRLYELTPPQQLLNEPVSNDDENVKSGQIKMAFAHELKFVS